MDTLQKLVSAVQNAEESTAIKTARKAVEEGVAINEIIDALTAGMRETGDRFARMDIFLPELMLAAQAMQSVMRELDPVLEKSAARMEKKGTVVIGTVEGDMHEIGKDIAIVLLRSQGFDVHDLRSNVNALDFVRKAEEVCADIIGASALMTTTMPCQKEIIRFLNEKGIREKYHVILGGAPVTRDWVEECGADSWGENAMVAVEILDQSMAKRRR